ncbi:FUSC family protein [Nonomuraea sp. NPDC047529]|uniref:FUSC family protein n=1 Tax=Nonomuraea sp. NPDC047529 TaxID=3155623 RepID=UPI00340536F6
MRGAARALRDGFSLPARPPWGYGLLCGLAVAGPLLAGVLAGRPQSGAFLALGAYLTAFGDTYGQPYAARARFMAIKIVLIAAGCWLGLFLADRPWWAVLALGLAAAAGARWRTVGTPPVFALVTGFYLAVPASFGPPELMVLGGLLYAVLALALWPLRRFDPLTTALDEAVQATAGLLDGLAGDDRDDRHHRDGRDGWDDLRERASKALGAAATASAAFETMDATGRSADAYVKALVRIFHETVALRALRAAAPDEQDGIDDVATTLAADLRVAADGRRAGAVEALAVTADYAERLAAREPAGDPAALRSGAVLGQARRCLDRIALGVRTVGSLAARHTPQAGRGVLPGLPWKRTAGRGVPTWKHAAGRGVPTWKHAAGRGLPTWKSGVLTGKRTADRGGLPGKQPGMAWEPAPGGSGPEHAGRLGITAAVAMALMLGVHEQYGKWFVFTVLLAVRPTYGDTVERVVLRVAGTVAGAAGAALILAAVPGPYTIVGTVLVFGTLGFALREVSYGYWSVFATPLAMMLTDFSTRLDWEAAGIRLALTAGGGVLALVAARLLWPRGQAGRLRGLSAELLREHGRLIRTLAERDLDRLPDRTESAGTASDRLRESLDKLDKEPGGSAPAELRAALTLARKLRDDAILLGAVLRGAEPGSDATAGVLDAVADRLDAVGQAVREREPPPAADAFESELDDVAREVSSLMEEAVAGEGTAVRRRLRHAVTAHPALRSLCKDALDLAAEVTARFRT